MDYNKFKPSPDLQSFVECYFVWSGETSSPLDLQSPPSGYAAIVFNNGDPYKAYQLNTDVHLVPDAYVSGQFTSNYHLVMEGKIQIVGIVFKPSGIYNYFNCRMSELVNTRKPLDLLIGREAEDILTALAASWDNNEKIMIIENFLLNKLSEAKKKLSIIDEAIDYIDTCKGCVSIEAVANHFKISRRYLEKKFLEKVGTSPKLYTRLKRFSVLSNKVAHLENPDWQEIILESGLHDQSHLSKEYNEFNRMSPNEYYHHNQELLRLVKDNKV